LKSRARKRKPNKGILKQSSVDVEKVVLMVAETAEVAYIFPGQGAQFVGMGRDIYDDYDSARAVFDQADEALGFPLSNLIFNGPEEELRQTVNAQPAIVTVSLALLSVIRSITDNKSLPTPAFVAGHSLGEYTAMAAAGIMDFVTAIYLTHQRGRLMHNASLENPGGMAAIIGLDEGTLADICKQSNAGIVNFNCPGQLVISGDEKSLIKATELAEIKGAKRIITLQVSGAFHTHYMQPAADSLAEILNDIHFETPLIPIIANTTASQITSAEMANEELLNQLCNSVQWQRSIEYMIDNGITTFIEIGPGRALSGLIKRINRDVRTINIGDAEAIRNIKTVC
jgi:[acyl-carrier-protein] S-malonyltransferase